VLNWMIAELRGWTFLRCALAAFALVGCALFQHASAATEAQIKQIEPLIGEGHLTMDLDVALKLSPIVIEAAERGVPLYFTLDVKITAPRWWWWDKPIVETSLTRRMSYNTLTQQWRVASGDLFLPVSSLQEALSVLERSVVGPWRRLTVLNRSPTAHREAETAKAHRG